MGGKICPFLVLVDSQGNIINKHTGYNPGDEKKLEKEIVHLLGMPVLGDTVHTDLEIITKDTTSIISPENK